MATGTVKWFNDPKGFGFLTPDATVGNAADINQDGRDVFVHHTAIAMQGFRTLAEGQRVEFDVIDSPKGPQAQNVRTLE